MMDGDDHRTAAVIAAAVIAANADGPLHGRRNGVVAPAEGDRSDEMWGRDTTYDDDNVRRLCRLTGDVRDDGIRHAVAPRDE